MPPWEQVIPEDLSPDLRLLAEEVGLEAVLRIIWIAGGTPIYLYHPSTSFSYPSGSLRDEILQAIGPEAMERVERLAGGAYLNVISPHSVLARVAVRLAASGENLERVSQRTGVSRRHVLRGLGERLRV